MRIGIDAYPLSRQLTGIGIYLYNMIKNLEMIDKENEYFLYSRPGIRLPFEYNPRWHIRPMRELINKSSTLWMQFNAKRYLLEDNIDIFWGTESILPLNLPSKIKKILTVHDLTWYKFPLMVNWDNRIIFPLLFKKSLKFADMIIADSNCTATSIKELMPDLRKKISIIYGGVCWPGEVFNKFKKTDIDYIFAKFKIYSKYILTVGTIEPRKNIVNLLKAFSFLLENSKKLDYQLLIVGGKGWQNSEIYKTYRLLNFKDNQVRFLGYVPDEELYKLYSAAEVFVFPSLYEGFGLPPLEAMACATPVVASDIPIFKEILGDAAILVNPYNPKEIADGIRQVLNDVSLAEELRKKGLERIKLFSWEKSSRALAGLFQDSIKI